MTINTPAERLTWPQYLQMSHLSSLKKIHKGLCNGEMTVH